MWGTGGNNRQNNYTPFMNYLQDRLICNRHCSTEYNKLLYMCVEEGYCELLVLKFFRFFIYSTCNFAIPGTSIAGMRERGVQIQLSI